LLPRVREVLGTCILFLIGASDLLCPWILELTFGVFPRLHSFPRALPGLAALVLGIAGVIRLIARRSRQTIGALGVAKLNFQAVDLSQIRLEILAPDLAGALVASLAILYLAHVLPLRPFVVSSLVIGCSVAGWRIVVRRKADRDHRAIRQLLRYIEYRACPICGYLLTGGPLAGSCPECGSTYNVARLEVYWNKMGF